MPSSTDTDVPAELTAEQLAARAKKVEDNIIAGARQVRSTVVKLAPFLHEFFEGRMWEPLGIETAKEWCAGPEIDLTYSYAKGIAQVYRELVLERGVTLEQLNGTDVRKLQATLPAIRAGDVEVEAAISDCQTLGRRDLVEKYRGDPNAPINPEDEPVRLRCDHCGSWYTPEEKAA